MFATARRRLLLESQAIRVGQRQATRRYARLLERLVIVDEQAQRLFCLLCSLHNNRVIVCISVADPEIYKEGFNYEY